MKKTSIIMAGMAVLFALSCNKQEEPSTVDNGVELSVTIDSENGTKATLSDDAVNGIFRFSNGDVIKVCTTDGTVKSGTTVSTSNAGAFTMDDGFNKSIGGIVGFPASLVTGMSNNGESASITFNLPASYDYSEVGGSNPNTSKICVPMIGQYAAPGSGQNPKVTLKQAGAVVRFKITNILEGMLTFTFPTAVAGTVTLTSVPSGTGDGIVFDKNTDKVITVTNVPTVSVGSDIYITLPVPTGTKPKDILVTNTPTNPEEARRIVALSGSNSSLERATGYRISAKPISTVTPTFKVAADKKVVLAPGNLIATIGSYDTENGVATASSWRFGGSFEVIGDDVNAGNYLFVNSDSNCVGKEVDLFSWQGDEATTKAQGLVNILSEKRTGSAADQAVFNSYFAGNNLYAGCWETKDGNPSSDLGDYIHITNGGEYKWRPLTKEEWQYMLLEEDRGALVGVTAHSRFTRAIVAGIVGLLIFPDSADQIWDAERMGNVPERINDRNKYQNWQEYTAANMVAMSAVGIVFLPSSGFRLFGIPMGKIEVTRIIGYVNEGATYWTGTKDSATTSYRMGFYQSTLYLDDSGLSRAYGFAVRLARDVDV